MTTPSDIGWGSYQEYEGIFFRGTKALVLPSNPTESQRILQVVTSTEGGRADALNGYDRAVISTGFIQFAESPYFLVSKLLGAIAERDPGLLKPLQPALSASGATFGKTARGSWRFQFSDARGEVDTATEQQQLFLLHSNGHKGSWDDASKAHAKLWAASMANTLAQEAAIAVQVDYTASRLLGFATANAQAALFKDAAKSDGWVGAMRAGYLSFAANLPAVAGQHLDIAMKSTLAPKWSKDWCIHLFKELTFGPKIAIYPARYQAIRPVIEKLYGVDLPDFAADLAKWTEEMTKDNPVGETEPNFFNLREVQAFLIGMGFDLGPAGADGILGSKTKGAILTFQGLHGLQANGILDPKTRAMLLEVWRQVCV
jgi:murein L,D-transpeptidase YcbB/YkuD